MVFDTALANGFHFFALTDHDSWLTQELWDEISHASNATTANNAVIGLRGFEYTLRTQGRVGVYNTTTWVTRDDPSYESLTKFYTWLAGQAGALAELNHPDRKYGGDFNNLAFSANVAEKIVSQEVGNNDNGYIRFDSQYPTSLNHGWRVASTNNFDLQGLVWGVDSTHRTGIIAPLLTPANVLDVLRARHVFATEDSNLAIALQSDGV